ncbi:hypothetical protein PO002_01395 [Cupriavidus necator]|uniref:hypothetical protein n=1 Tax=Cupriavidus necator TaxID=106590 RepID=UPI0039C052B3
MALFEASLDASALPVLVRSVDLTLFIRVIARAVEVDIAEELEARLSAKGIPTGKQRNLPNLQRSQRVTAAWLEAGAWTRVDGGTGARAKFVMTCRARPGGV